MNQVQSTREEIMRFLLLQANFSFIVDIVSQDAHNRFGDQLFSSFLERSRIPSDNTLKSFNQVSFPSYFDKYCFVSIQQSTREEIFRLLLLQANFSFILDLVSQDACNRLGDHLFSCFLERSRIQSDNTLKSFYQVSFPSYFDKYCFVS